MSWTQPLCNSCWEATHPGRTPIRVMGDYESCCECGTVTTSGIYVRRDPTVVPYPRYVD